MAFCEEHGINGPYFATFTSGGRNTSARWKLFQNFHAHATNVAASPLVVFTTDKQAQARGPVEQSRMRKRCSAR